MSASSGASASSYASLLRRSKLASYNPHIDQVYTANSANRARANYGLKRPLPALSPAAGARSPFVRVTDLDSPERRTSYRRATREQQYTKKWLEVDSGIASEALIDRSGLGYGYGGSSGTAGLVHRKWDRLPVQSRFLAPGTPGAVQSVDQVAQQPPVPTLPNFFALSPADFERFLASLGDRRADFRAFVLAEANKLAEQTGGATGNLNDADFDLYAHAQRNPLELLRLVERFLRRPAATGASNSAPLPQVHPTLALQYATPTPLESALAAPLPGRLLGPAPDGSSSRFYGRGGGRKPDVYASILSQVAPVPPNATAGVAQTNFFPDVEGHRSNLPGRASFRISPTMSPVPYANQTAILRTGVRKGSHEFRPPTAEYEPALLALHSVRLNPTVVPPSAALASPQTPAPAPRPGSPTYSGALPRDLRGAGAGGAGDGRGAGSPVGSRQNAGTLSDLMEGYAFNSSRSRAAAAASAAGAGTGAGVRRPGRTPEEQRRWLERREQALGEGGVPRRGQAGGAGGKRKQGGQARGENRKRLMATLEGLLEKSS